MKETITLRMDAEIVQHIKARIRIGFSFSKWAESRYKLEIMSKDKLTELDKAMEMIDNETEEKDEML
jgi:hypothetical protein